jgi:hypothetical protein
MGEVYVGAEAFSGHDNMTWQKCSRMIDVTLVLLGALGVWAVSYCCFDADCETHRACPAELSSISSDDAHCMLRLVCMQCMLVASCGASCTACGVVRGMLLALCKGSRIHSVASCNERVWHSEVHADALCGAC